MRSFLFSLLLLSNTLFSNVNQEREEVQQKSLDFFENLGYKSITPSPYTAWKNTGQKTIISDIAL